MTLSLLRNVVRALSALALITLVACAPRPRGASPVVSIDHALAAASTADSRPAPPPAVPSAVSSALLPTVGVGNVASSTPAEPRFDISADNTPARDFFMGLVKGTPYNMVVHPDVTGKITLHLRNVTVPEVMKTVHDVYGYEYRHGAAGFEVMPVGLQTKMFYVNYLDITRKGRSETRVSSGQ
ncbi:MAG TPA: secretin N-terminal domain-containing protein, partial [Desulfuromonadales bacterium]|nr:secretin N-terminal domain-containing protein [Desulfuromonadales bacterium]